jgi:hypothetical protein
MPIPPFLTELYKHGGPFASVYLDASRQTESGGAEVELRWRGLQAELQSSGADEANLAALDAVAGRHRDLPRPHGQFLVASGGELLVDAITARPPLRQLSRWSLLPHVTPFLAARMTQVPHLLAQIDRTGADLSIVIADQPEQDSTVVGTAQEPIHKTGRNDWSERHFQNRVDDAWETNSKDVARAIRDQLPASATLVLLAGDPRARAMVEAQLSQQLASTVQVVQLHSGGRADGVSPSALADEVQSAVLRHVWRDRRDVLASLQQAIGRGDYGVAGVGPVVEVLRKAQIETLVLSDDPSSTLSAFVGPGPLDLALDATELEALGVEVLGRDRLDSAVVRALAGTAADIFIVPGAHDFVTDGIAALLRYADGSTPH